MGELFSITCPICGIEIGIDQSDLDKPLICECGYAFIVDSERNVTPVDYNAVPKAAWMRKMFDRGVLITTTEMRDAIQK